MKITVSVNLNGQVFTIDEDAYQRLKAYLAAVSGQFASNDDRNEIISDIEGRIAELFRERISPSKQSIVTADVEWVIGIMGAPRDFNPGEPAGNSTSDSNQGRNTRRLYRDPDNRILGGVSSGIALWLNIDPVIVRLLFILSFFAFGPFLYIVLWIIIPLARTSAQKLEMRGEEVTIDNIEQIIKEEFREVKHRFNNFKKKEALDKIEFAFGHIGNNVIRLLSVFGKFVATVVLVAFVVAMVIFVLFAVNLQPINVLSQSFSLGNADLGPLKVTLETLMEPSNANLLAWGVILFVGAMLLSIIVGLGRLITGFYRFKFISAVLFLLWLAGVGFIVATVFSEGKHFRKSGSSLVSQDLALTKDSSLVISLTGSSSVASEHFSWNDFENTFDFAWGKDGRSLVCSKGSITYYAAPYFRIEPSAGGKAYVSFDRRASGADSPDAVGNARDIAYQWNTSGGEIALAPVFSIQNKKWRHPALFITIYVPVGTSVTFTNGACRFTNYVFMDNRTYTMTAGGLE